MKAAPRGLGVATMAAATSQVLQAQQRQQQQQQEAEAARRQAEREAAIAQADDLAREKEKRLYELRRQQDLIDAAHEQRVQNSRTAILRAEQERQSAARAAQALQMHNDKRSATKGLRMKIDAFAHRERRKLPKHSVKKKKDWHGNSMSETSGLAYKGLPKQQNWRQPQQLRRKRMRRPQNSIASKSKWGWRL